MAEVPIMVGEVPPLVSVVIPSYNHDRFLSAAMASVLEQTEGSLELIVIDDGSQDDSVDIATMVGARDARVRVVRQENAGSHAAINRGLQMARGEWLAILNSDDLWEPERLQRLLERASRDHAQFLFSDSILIDAENEPVTDPAHWWNYSVQRMRDRVRSEGVENGMLYGNLAVSTSNFLFRRELLASVGCFRRFRYNLDWDYVLRCLDTPGVRVSFVDEPLFRYRLHGNNAILSGMPGSAAEAQIITRQIYRRRLKAPCSLLLSHHRHDRLLRRYLELQARDYRESMQSVEADRDSMAELIRQRQQIIEAERRLNERERSGMQALLAEQKQAHDADIAAFAQEFEGYREQSHRQFMATYMAGIDARLQRDIQRCRELRMIEYLEGRTRPGMANTSRSLFQRIVRVVRSQRRINESLAFLVNGMPLGAVRNVPRDPVATEGAAQTIAVHLHIYYRDVAMELVADALRIRELKKVVITGPWRREDLGEALELFEARGIEVQVLVVPNRGKDVGGFLAAIRDGGLLDSDLILKLHSKKSHNPDSYFQAISALFGLEIHDGDQWRRALVHPLAGNELQVESILKLFREDPAIGMVGAKPFITNVPDANADLSRSVYERFAAPQGVSFVAGTMFWVRSSLLKPLLDGGLMLDEFTLDSREVEGGLEHVMERMLGALVIGSGFDMYGVEG